MKQRIVTIQEVHDAARYVAEKIRLLHSSSAKLYGIPRGGIPAAFAVSQFTAGEVVDDPDKADIFIDDLIDSGATRRWYEERFPGKPFYTLFDKSRYSDWLVFPWERNEQGSAEDIPTRLLQFIGEDPQRGGLIETPKRFLKAWKEYSSGYGKDPAEILKVFEIGRAHV